MQTQIKVFENIFKVEPGFIIFSPGRVNLIGEHTDYSGGLVFPMALSLGIQGVYSVRQDKLIKVYSDTYKELGILTISLDDLTYKKGFSYGNYVQGTLDILNKHNFKLKQGFNLYLSSTLPASSGLSSSAALEMLVIGIYESINNDPIKPIDAVNYARAVENEYFKLSSGIMDQFAVKFGKKGHAMFLNTKTLSVTYVPFDLSSYSLYLMNTNKKRNLEESSYNERFKSVNTGEKYLTNLLDVESLGDVKLNTFNNVDQSRIDPKILKRIRHVVNENDRVFKAYEVLINNDIDIFGKLLYESHYSLRDDFNVSCEELDFLVEENKQLGAIGARMTGAGFGGTMIALYPKANAPKDFELMRLKYSEKFKKRLDIFNAESSDGVNWEVL